MKAILGKKLRMQQIFAPEGEAIPTTLIQAGPCPVVQIRTLQKDGYSAIQVGFQAVKKVSKPLDGHFKKAKVTPMHYLRELPRDKSKDYKLGDELKVDIFKKGEYVNITGISKGKGFQGGVKRWGWHGGPASHGSMQHRAIGSVGASSFPSKVVKGHHMAGHMGAGQVTVQNLKIVKIIPEKDLLIVRGAVPGPRGSLLVIKKSKREIREKKILSTTPAKQSARAARKKK